MITPQAHDRASRRKLASRVVIVAILACAVGAALYLRPGPRETAHDTMPPVATLESAPPAAASPSPPPAAADQPTTAATASPEDPSPAKAAAGEMAEPPARQKALPRLVDLGADKCIPCKMMAPVLAELRQEYAGRFDVVFIDVWKNKGEAQKNGVRIIPTQIFYDASGKELFRHQGFFSKEDILKTWQKYGLDFARENAAAGSS